MSGTKLLFIDVETTGFSFELNSITQLAGILDIDGEIVEAFDIPMRPFTGEEVHPEALKVQGITEEEVWARQDPAEALNELVSYLDKHIDKFDKKDKVLFLGWNAKFDYDFVREWANKCGFPYIGSYIKWPPIDVAGLLALELDSVRYELENFKLETVAKYKGIVPRGQVHDAMVDITLTRDLWYKLGGAE